MPRKLTRKEKEDIRKELDKLDAIDLRNETPDSLRRRLEVVRTMLTKADADPSSGLFRDYTDMVAAGERYFKEERPQNQPRQVIQQPARPEILLPTPDFSLPKREYVGMSGQTKIQVVLEREELALSRKYGTAAIVFWNFNREGRISSVFTKPFNTYSSVQVIKTSSKESRPDWMNGEMEVRDLPSVCSALNPGFCALPEDQKYAAIMRFGHGMLFGLLRDIQEDRIRESYGMKPRQMTLVKIAQDPTAIYIANQAASITPEVNLYPQGSADINYRPNKPYFTWNKSK